MSPIIIRDIVKSLRFRIWNFCLRLPTFPGLRFSPEPQGCGSAETCFDISVQRSFFTESLKSVALVVPEIKILKNFIFHWIQVWRNIVTLLSFLGKTIFEAQSWNEYSKRIYVIKLETFLAQNLLKLLIQC